MSTDYAALLEVADQAAKNAHVPYSKFHVGAALVAEDGRRAVFSCAAGVRSVHALMAAQNAGLDLAEHYKGGFKDWYSAGETVD